MRSARWMRVAAALAPLWFVSAVRAAAGASGGFRVFVSNERSGDVTVIDGTSGKVEGTIPVGKRPRGIHASPDGKLVYVALSGRPIEGPPALDAQGNPILHKGHDDDDDVKSDRAADGIGVIGAAAAKFLGKLPGGSDPEQFAVSADGSTLYISNEDVATASFVRVADGKVEHLVRVGKEPEGVGVTPDGRRVYVTCETTGQVFVIDAATHKAVGRFDVGGRPRSVVFLPDGSRAYVPSESAGQVHMIDTATLKVLKTLQLPPGNRPMGTAMAPDGKHLYVTTGRGGNVCVIDPTTLELRETIKVGARPWGIALSPDARRLFTANGPSNDVSVVDLGSEREVSRIKAGQSPWGLTVVVEAEVNPR